MEPLNEAIEDLLINWALDHEIDGAAYDAEQFAGMAHYVADRRQDEGYIVPLGPGTGVPS